MHELAKRIASYARGRLPQAAELEVVDVERIHGGASRETYRLKLRYRDGASLIERRLILRRDPPGSLIETDRAIEFAAYRAFHATSVPVPEAIWLENDPSHLDYPFFVMAELSGLDASPANILLPPYAAHHEKLAQQKWSILGAIAAADPEKLGLVGVMKPVALADVWRRELEHWTGVIDEDELAPQPIIRAAIQSVSIIMSRLIGSHDPSWFFTLA